MLITDAVSSSSYGVSPMTIGHAHGDRRAQVAGGTGYLLAELVSGTACDSSREGPAGWWRVGQEFRKHLAPANAAILSMHLYEICQPSLGGAIP